MLRPGMRERFASGPVALSAIDCKHRSNRLQGWWTTALGRSLPGLPAWDRRGLPSVCGIVGLGPVAADKFLQWEADDTANCVQFQQIHPADTVLVFAYDGLIHAKGGGQLFLREPRLFTDGTQQRQKHMLPLSATAQSWAALRHETASVAGLDLGCDYRIPLTFRTSLSFLDHWRAR